MRAIAKEKGRPMIGQKAYVGRENGGGSATGESKGVVAYVTFGLTLSGLRYVTDTECESRAMVQTTIIKLLCIVHSFNRKGCQHD
jgi:hypothetical protein